MRLHTRLGMATATFLLTAGAWFGLLSAERWRSDDYRFDFASWELAAAPNKWLYALGRPLRQDHGSPEALQHYFALSDRGSEEAARFKGEVEAVIEGRIDAVLQDLGLPALPGLSVWPPVDIELSSPPRVLAESPRARIRLASAVPLRPELSTDTLLQLERDTEVTKPDRSAIVLPLGGISTYPAIVTDRASYADTVEVAAHEWVHHYLAFHPLGRAALRSREALTVNETVADIVGREVGALVLERFGDPTGSVEDNRPSPASATLVEDRNAMLRSLRREVDDLLAAGQVEEAERRMEDARGELQTRGIGIRRLNQAYFAWYGTYAARPDSIDPVGASLREVRRLAGSLPRFLELVRGATSKQDVSALLEELRVSAR